MKKSQLRQLIREEISRWPSDGTGYDPHFGRRSKDYSKDLFNDITLEEVTKIIRKKAEDLDSDVEGGNYLNFNLFKFPQGKYYSLRIETGRKNKRQA
mgnify:FL=1